MARSPCPFHMVPVFSFVLVESSSSTGLQPLFPCNANPRGEREMKSIRAVSAALIALGVGMAGPASAMPQTRRQRATISSSRSRSSAIRTCAGTMCQNTSAGCGIAIANRIAGSSSSIGKTTMKIAARDCHREVRRHYLPEYGRRVYHRHVGERCRIRVYNQYQGAAQAVRTASGSGRSRSAKTSSGTSARWRSR